MEYFVIIQQSLEHGAQQIRLRKGSPLCDADGNRLPIEYDCKPLFSGKRRGWVILDSFTASALLAVYNGINETHRAKFDIVPLNKLVDLAWKSCGTRKAAA